MLGWMTDYIKKKKQKNATTDLEFKIQEIHTHLPAQTISTISCIIFCSLPFVLNESTIYILLISMTILRSSYGSIVTAFLRSRFPMDHLHRMLGIYGFVTFFALLLLQPNLVLIMHYYYIGVGINLILALLMFSFPLHLVSKDSIMRNLR